MLLTLAVLLSGTVLSGRAIRLLSGLPDRAIRIDEIGIGAPKLALLLHDLAA